MIATKATTSNVEYLLQLAYLKGCNTFPVPAKDKAGAIKLANKIRQYEDCEVRFDYNNMIWIAEMILGNRYES